VNVPFEPVIESKIVIFMGSIPPTILHSIVLVVFVPQVSPPFGEFTVIVGGSGTEIVKELVLIAVAVCEALSWTIART
jgi:hypothetical protein